MLARAVVDSHLQWVKISKVVSGQLKVSRTVEQAIEVRGDEVAERITDLLFPDGAPEQLDAQGFVHALRLALQRAGSQLEAAELAHATELADDVEIREARDDARAGLLELLGRARAVLLAAYGSEAVERAGLRVLSERRNHQQLVGHARYVIEQLQPEILGAPTDELLPVDLKALGLRLAAAAEQLEGTLSDLERERREAQVTLELREAASAQWRRHYNGAANAFVALATLAGLDAIAQRVKPTARRRAGRPEAIDELEGEALVEELTQSDENEDEVEVPGDLASPVEDEGEGEGAANENVALADAS